MEDIEHTLKEKLRDIISDRCLQNPKVNVSEAVKGGYLGIPSKIIIEGQKNGQTEILRLFLKAAPKGKVTRETGCIREVFLNEIVMYTEIFPTLLEFQNRKAVSAPFNSIGKCLGASVVDGHEFLIFEDLTALGYALWDKTKPMTTDNVEYVFKQTAKYHAMSFALQDQQPELFKTLVGKLNSDLLAKVCSNSTFMPLLTKSFENARKCFDPLKEYDILKKFDDFLKNEVWHLFKNYAVPEEAIIIHGDSWCNNFMFHFDEKMKIKKMIFLDWQMSRLASPVIDLSYFFFCNGPQLALDNFNHYLKVYHDTLSLAIKDMGSDPERIFPFRTLEEHWRKYAKFAIIMTCLVTMVIFGHSEVIDLVGSMSEGRQSAAELYDSKKLLTSPEYFKRIRATIIHFVKNGCI